MTVWIRRVAPPLPVVFWALGLYAAPYGLLMLYWPWSTESHADWMLWIGDYESLAGAIAKSRYHEGLLLLFAALYGVWRVLGFSPVARGGYARWLLTTPWNVGLPLPLGPRHWVVHDAIILLFLSALAAWHTELDPVYLLATFGISYLVLLAFELRSLGEKASTFFLAFALGLIALGWKQPLVLLVVMAGMYGLAHASLRRAMTRFLWDRDPRNRWPTGKKEEVPVVWPYTALRLDPPGPSIDWIDGIGVSLLTGWGLWVALRIEPPLPGEVVELTRTLQGLAFLVAAARVGVYMLRRLPPISLAGRFATGRWIIPSYDQIFLAPLAVMLVTGFLPVMARRAGANPEFYLPIGTAIVLLIAFNAGPMVKRWELVGEHRAYAVTPPVS